ncbi:ceramide glucosyltransferase-like [Mytilus trossulus]|uniref:ceramide glucosyltransferase-like n=1 Tax=Mytilus trossulus TaxID=6551 RepID=UPI00300732F8
MSVEQYFAVGLAIAIVGGWLFDWLMHTVAIIYGIRRLHRQLPTPSPEDLPGVSIIKPLVGVDPHLYANLESFFKLQYPNFEILFCVQEESDPAIMIVQKLMELYPKVDAKLFIGIKYICPNGKINNMIKAYEAAKNENLLISDSCIKMNENTLMEMVCCLKPDVGMVVQMPFFENRPKLGFASVYEKVYFATFNARSTLGGFATGINACTGMSCLFRREPVDKAGGLAPLGQYLSEDYILNHTITQAGYKSVLCTSTAQQNSGYSSVGTFHKRIIRWSQLRIALLPHLIILEPLSECMLMGACASWAIEYLFGISSMGVFLMHILLWFLLDYTLLRVVENGPLPFSKFEFVVAWLMRETLALFLTLQSHRNTIVKWRHKQYKLNWGGKIEEV